MTLAYFRSECYRILEKRGHKEINGELFYPESSIMDLMEFIKEHPQHFEESNLQEAKDKLVGTISQVLQGFKK